MTEHRVTVRDGEVLYVKLLGAEHTTKPLVIATHGGAGLSTHEESENSHSFLSSHFRVLLYDMRGCGDSTSKGPFTHDQYVADLDDLRYEIKALICGISQLMMHREWVGDREVILAGGSYGGFVSLEYVVKYPQRVSCLLLRSTLAMGRRLIVGLVKTMLTSHRIEHNAERVERITLGENASIDDLSEFAADLSVIYRAEYTAAGERREVPPRQRPQLNRRHVEVVNFNIAYNMPRYDVRPQLPGISAPTLVVVGKQDPMTTVAHNQEIASLMPRAEMSILPGASHMLPEDEMDAWMQEVWLFLETHEFCDRSE